MSCDDKASALKRVIDHPSDLEPVSIFEVNPKSFGEVPRSPFAYWVPAALRKSFKKYPALKRSTRFAARGPYTLDDFRFLRLTCELPRNCVKNDREHTLAVNAWDLCF